MSSIKSHNEIYNSAVAVDIVVLKIINGELCVLCGLIDNPENYFYNKYALIGGLVYADEKAEQSIDRLLVDKAGVKEINKTQLHTFTDPKRDPRGRVISIAYISLVGAEQEVQTHKAGIKTEWFPIKKTPKLAYDHDEMISFAISNLRDNDNHLSVAKLLLPKEFTMNELQSVYEILLDKEIDKRNFRKQILKTGELKELEKTKREGVMRPASLFTFITKKR